MRINENKAFPASPPTPKQPPHAGGPHRLPNFEPLQTPAMEFLTQDNPHSKISLPKSGGRRQGREYGLGKVGKATGPPRLPKTKHEGHTASLREPLKAIPGTRTRNLQSPGDPQGPALPC